MESGPLALLYLGLAVVVVLGVAVARRTGLPDPVVLVVVGFGASFLPGVPQLQIPPEVVFLVFLPPLLFRASFLTSLQTLRQHATAIALLSVGLVVTTAEGSRWSRACCRGSRWRRDSSWAPWSDPRTRSPRRSCSSGSARPAGSSSSSRPRAS